MSARSQFRLWHALLVIALFLAAVVVIYWGSGGFSGRFHYTGGQASSSPWYLYFF